jgi:hypothetical protein
MSGYAEARVVSMMAESGGPDFPDSLQRALQICREDALTMSCSPRRISCSHNFLFVKFEFIDFRRL